MRRLILPLILVAGLAAGAQALTGPASEPGPRISAAVQATSTTSSCPEGTTLGVDGLCHGACPIVGTTTCRDTPAPDPTTTTVPEPTTTTTAPPPPPPATAAPAVPRASWPSSLQPCDGRYPPCSVAWDESRGDYTAINWQGPYFGKWQFLQSTWDSAALNNAGRPDLVGVRPDQASPADQDAVAAALWDDGRGCSHWGACR